MADPHAIKMPQLSDTMTEGVVVSWEKNPGDKLERGDIVATIETDKAIMDVEVFRAGYLSGPLAAINDVVPVGEPIGYIAATPEDVQADAADSTASADTQQRAAQAPSEIHAADRAPRHLEAVSHPAAGDGAPPAHSDRRPAPRPANKHASPYARKLAAERGINLNAVTGTGPARMVAAADVLQAQPLQRPDRITPLPSPYEMPEVQVAGEGRPMSAMERALSHKMTAALTMPTFNATVLVRPDALLNEAKRLGVSVTVAIAKACAVTITSHPTINWCYQPVDRIVERDHVDIGMAVATETGGLVTPVLRGCHSRDLIELNAEWKALVERARQRRLRQEEYSNATFQISNLGMYGVAQFDAIPTPGLGAILAVAAAGSEGLPLTLTADHRVINGVDAAQFLSTLKQNIEDPARWLS
ncbi:MAG: dihydrolipoamide acetyltransferase family protein [Gammaproteobacteria bacterium]